MPRSKTLEVNGRPAQVVDGTVPQPAPIVEVPVESLLIQMAELDQKVEHKASEHSRVGIQLKELKDQREQLRQTLSKRGEKLRRPEQPPLANIEPSADTPDEESLDD